MSRQHFLRIFGIDRLQILLGATTFLAFLGFTALFTYFYFARDIKSEEALMNRKKTGVVLLDRDDKPFFTFYEGKVSRNLNLSEIPDFTELAVIAIEDHEFYSHNGFSIKGIGRSIITNIKNNNLANGGSTITQQLIKNSLLTPRKDFLRKFQEIVLASEVERRFSKEQILTMYLNSVYFGRGSFGIEKAARNYFDKDARDLTITESAYLAGLLPAPSRLSRHLREDSEAEKRSRLVLEKMLEYGFLTKKEVDNAISDKLNFKKTGDVLNTHAPHFALMVRDQLIEKYGEETISRSGFIVRTSLNLDWQKYAEDAVAKQVAKLARNRVTNGALVALDPKTGQIMALVGSSDWSNEEWGKFNVATAPRQPGSSFKPFIYALAFEKGVITPSTLLNDEHIIYQTQVGPYEPKNYDGKFRGKVLPRQALAHSLNLPAIDTTEKVGVEEVINYAQKLGFTTINDPSHFGLSLGLGSGEVRLLDHTSAYATLANSGVKQEPVGIINIRDKFGNTIYEWEDLSGEQAVDAKAAFIVSSILSDNSARREVFGANLTISRPAAAKTGTTQNYKDGWTLGYTPNLAVGVWVGNNNGRLMNRVAGSLGAAPIWKSVMEKILKDLPREEFQMPGGLIAMSICEANGLRAIGANAAARQEYFISGSEPKGICNPYPTPPELAQNQEGRPIPSLSTQRDPAPENNKPESGVGGAVLDVLIKPEKKEEKEAD